MTIEMLVMIGLTFGTILILGSFIGIGIVAYNMEK